MLQLCRRSLQGVVGVDHGGIHVRAAGGFDRADRIDDRSLIRRGPDLGDGVTCTIKRDDADGISRTEQFDRGPRRVLGELDLLPTH